MLEKFSKKNTIISSFYCQNFSFATNLEIATWIIFISYNLLPISNFLHSNLHFKNIFFFISWEATSKFRWQQHDKMWRKKALTISHRVLHAWTSNPRILSTRCQIKLSRKNSHFWVFLFCGYTLLSSQTYEIPVCDIYLHHKEAIILFAFYLFFSIYFQR